MTTYKNPKRWMITIQHFGTKKTKVVTMPGGLHESEARRCATLGMRDGAYWKVIGADHATP